MSDDTARPLEREEERREWEREREGASITIDSLQVQDICFRVDPPLATTSKQLLRRDKVYTLLMDIHSQSKSEYFMLKGFTWHEESIMLWGE